MAEPVLSAAVRATGRRGVTWIALTSEYDAEPDTPLLYVEVTYCDDPELLAGLTDPRRRWRLTLAPIEEG